MMGEGLPLRVVKGLGQGRWPVAQGCVKGQETWNVVRGQRVHERAGGPVGV